MTSGEHERTGGVRGAINDLLGLGERRGERDADRRGTPDATPGPDTDHLHGAPVPGDGVPGDRLPGDRVPGDRVPGNQMPDDQVAGDQVPGYRAPVDQGPADTVGARPHPDQHAGGATSVGGPGDPGAVRTDRFDTVEGDRGTSVDDGREALFRRDDDGRDVASTGDPVPAPRGATSVGAVSGDQYVSDVPADAHFDAPSPSRPGPRHELLGENGDRVDDRVDDRRVDDGVRLHDEPADRHDDASGEVGGFAAAAGALGAGGAAAHHDTADRTGDHGSGHAGDHADAIGGSPASVGAGGSPASVGTGGSPASVGTDEDGRERLVPAQRATEYGTRWDQIKGEFVDEPRQAVAGADALVGELLDELQRLFAEQRHGLDRGFDADDASTEDLRLALRRYRSFFDRLLSI